jgi:hypothetical protein
MLPPSQWQCDLKVQAIGGVPMAKDPGEIRVRLRAEDKKYAELPCIKLQIMLFFVAL